MRGCAGDLPGRLGLSMKGPSLGAMSGRRVVGAGKAWGKGAAPAWVCRAIKSPKGSFTVADAPGSLSTADGGLAAVRSWISCSSGSMAWLG